MRAFLGIDVGKVRFHASLLVGDRSWSKSFSNTAAGNKQLSNWLKNHKTEDVHACMETTGGYEVRIASNLHELGHVVSIVNPARVKAFSQSEMLRTKTDAVDAALIARFCRAHVPRAWAPPAPELRILQSLVRRHASLQDMYRIETNRIEAAEAEATVKRSLRKHIIYLQREIAVIEREMRDLFDVHPTLCRQRNLLTTIPGIADLTASRLLAEIPNMADYASAKAVAAFAGLSPHHHQSGTSRGRTRIARTGNAKLRAELFFPALVAVRCNPIISAMYRRLIDAGKPKMVAIAAVMRKLLVLAYGVLKSQTSFDPAYATA